MSTSAENIIVRVRSRLRDKGIKLWIEPYYFEGIGPNENELDILAREFSEELQLSCIDCKLALTELQDGALEKLKARNQYDMTGETTLKARVIRTCSQNNDNYTVLELKHCLTALGSDVYNTVSNKLNCDENDVKIIFCGRVLQKEKNLTSQGIKGNLQGIILISSNKNASASIHERVRRAKEDALLILSSKDQEFMTMEDQDGNIVHLPPAEKDSLMLALALYEKGRSALKKSNFDEALVLFLEADEQFSLCQSDMLNRIDNYALLNLDIVWCYLCLKSFSYLPDAEKRLKICEKSFKKSYGDDMNRVSKLKENLIGNEKALIMRLHLLQGVLYYHQNKKDQAYEKLLTAEEEMSRLQLDDEKLINMLNMGYDILECRVALRACENNIEKAISYIAERRKKKEDARKRGKKERNINRDIKQFEGEDWINPKSVLTLVEMGFDTEIAAVALKKSKNDITKAMDLIQNNQEALISEIPNIKPNNSLVEQLCTLGFKKEMVETALKSFANSRDEAIEFLLKINADADFDNILKLIENTNIPQEITDSITSIENQAGPSNSGSSVLAILKDKIDKELEAKQAYDRFVEDVSTTDDEYLDVNFVQEKNILIEYQKLLIK